SVEGNHTAGYSGVWTSNHNGRPAYSNPSECDVNGSGCESMTEFNDLLPGVQEKQPTWTCLWLISYECADFQRQLFSTLITITTGGRFLLSAICLWSDY